MRIAINNDSDIYSNHQREICSYVVESDIDLDPYGIVADSPATNQIQFSMVHTYPGQPQLRS